jgi:hypothetical protein
MVRHVCKADPHRNELLAKKRMTATPYDLADWRDRGFAEAPVHHISNGGEEIVRAFSANPFWDAAGGRHGSFERGNCFFCFAGHGPSHPIGRIDRKKLSTLNVYELENAVNAALWNNTYQQIGVFALPKGRPIRYWLGYVGFNIKTAEQLNTSKGTVISPATMMHDRPSDNTLLQIVLNDPNDVQHLSLLEQHRVGSAYRYLGSRSPMWN